MRRFVFFFLSILWKNFKFYFLSLKKIHKSVPIIMLKIFAKKKKKLIHRKHAHINAEYEIP